MDGGARQYVGAAARGSAFCLTLSFVFHWVCRLSAPGSEIPVATSIAVIVVAPFGLILFARLVTWVGAVAGRLETAPDERFVAPLRELSGVWASLLVYAAMLISGIALGFLDSRLLLRMFRSGSQFSAARSVLIVSMLVKIVIGPGTLLAHYLHRRGYDRRTVAAYGSGVNLIAAQTAMLFTMPFFAAAWQPQA